MQRAFRSSLGWLVGGLLAAVLAVPAAWAQNESNPIDRFWSLFNAGRYVEAEQTAAQLLAVHRRNNRTAGVGIASLMLGRATEMLERYDQAEQYYRDALRSIPEKEGAALIAQTNAALGWLLKNQQRWDESQQCYLNYMTYLEAEEGKESAELVGPLTELAESYIQQSRFDDADRLLTRAGGIAAQQSPTPDYQIACIARTRGRLRDRQHRLVEAEGMYHEALRGFEQVKDANGAAIVSEDLALLFYPQSRYREAEEFAGWALRQRLQQFGAAHSNTANVQNSLGRIYAKQGRLMEAERLLKQALDTRIKTLGPNHGKVATSLGDLADVCAAQSRHGDAVTLLMRSLEIDEKIWGPSNQNLLPNLATLGYALLQLGRLDEAVEVAQRSLRIIGADNSAAGPNHATLGQIYLHRKEYQAAEREYLRAVELNERYVRETGNPYRRTVAPAMRGLARVYYATGRYNEAEQMFNKTIDTLERDGDDRSQLCVAYWGRGGNFWKKRELAAAAADFAKAMQLAEQMRSQFSGSDLDRSASFMNVTVVFEDMVRLQAAIGDVATALNAIERARNRSLLDQLSAHGIDLLDGMPREERAEFERRFAAAGARAAIAERQLDSLQNETAISADERQHRSGPLQRELNLARNEYVLIESDIRNASPAYRLAIGERHEPVSLDKLQEYVARQKGVLLRYIVGDQASFVLVVSASGTPQLLELTVDAELARALSVEPGPLDERELTRILRNDKTTGVLQLLRQSHRADVERQVETQLAALWQLLVPPTAQKLILNADCQRLMIVPDGDLAMLPFEALVVRDQGVSECLLDVGPPVQYGPSATILWNLAQRRNEGADSQLKVLTVGDPAMGTTAAGNGRSAGSAVHRAVTGKLTRLPYAGIESNWVAETFTKSGMQVSKLSGPAASEAAIRGQLAGKQLIHFACHGLVEPSYGNLFGALALAPGASNASNQYDDGFLTLAEIYQLNLRSAELTILSACDTNAGPGQIGEGVWALSRGFLVAGSRRVIASNWVVDDRAGATLISYYSNLLARTSDAKERDYAKTLHDAKRLLRSDERWRSPFYWSSLVLVGPN